MLSEGLFIKVNYEFISLLEFTLVDLEKVQSLQILQCKDPFNNLWEGKKVRILYLIVIIFDGIDRLRIYLIVIRCDDPDRVFVSMAPSFRPRSLKLSHPFDNFVDLKKTIQFLST